METSLKDTYDELIKNLFKPLIFYIPRRFWIEIDDGKWMDKEFDQLFDSVVLVKPDGNNQLLHNGASNFHMLSKTSSLDKNTYGLLDLKARIEPESFRFLSERYSLSVAFYKKISNWMVMHIHEDVPDVNKETLMSFEIQKTSFDNHWDYIQKHFSVPEYAKNYFADDDLSANDVTTMRDIINGDSAPTENMFEKLKEKSSKNVKKKIKKILITETEVEQFLLETVFKVKL
ncbi:hypothetical protein [Bizionia sp.]|uniref:hypothetical protein n=1 Tax=Bizionia sp. TaxID=1954480 RepID=UPI003A8C91FE